MYRQILQSEAEAHRQMSQLVHSLFTISSNRRTYTIKFVSLTLIRSRISRIIAE